VVGVIDTLDEKGYYDVDQLVSAVHETVVEGGKFRINVLISRAELEDSEDLAEHETGKGARWMAGCWRDVFADVHLSPIASMRVLNRIQFAASTSGSGSWSLIPRPLLMNLFREKRNLVSRGRMCVAS